MGSTAELLAFRFKRNQFDRIDEDLCEVLFAQRDLITIFQFDGEKSHGYLEEAILQSLFNGRSLHSFIFFCHRSLSSSEQIVEQWSTISSESIETHDGLTFLSLSLE